ncbi:MAG: hypothetical protein Q4P28_01695 [Tissierellia bacterium]|nr:hypothetical protein [Tissierellia bacterium]
MTIYKLKSFDEVMNIEGAYGGDQLWLKKYRNSSYYYRTGCGIIAATNILLYHSLTREDFNLFQGPLTMESYTDFAYEVGKVLKPTPIGVFTAFHMNHGVKQFTKNHDHLLLPMKNDWPWAIHNVLEYIIAGLVYDSPVMIMSWMSPKKDLRYHWLIITEIEIHDDGRIDMICSNWGKKVKYDFKKWFYSKSLYQTILYYL